LRGESTWDWIWPTDYIISATHSFQSCHDLQELRNRAPRSSQAVRHQAYGRRSIAGVGGLMLCQHSRCLVNEFGPEPNVDGSRGTVPTSNSILSRAMKVRARIDCLSPGASSGLKELWAITPKVIYRGAIPVCARRRSGATALKRRFVARSRQNRRPLIRVLETRDPQGGGQRLLRCAAGAGALGSFMELRRNRGWDVVSLSTTPARGKRRSLSPQWNQERRVSNSDHG